RPVSDTGLANWSARVREELDVTGLRVAQPLRSRDGRHVVSGWRADHALSGRPEARADETTRWTARLNDALAARGRQSGGPGITRWALRSAGTVSAAGLANWSARVREELDATGLRVAQPLRSRAGRHVVSGWRADHALSGRPEARADETIAWSARLNEALAAVERPRIVRRPAARPWSGTDLFACAEAASWDGDPEVDLAPGMEDRGTPFATHRAAALLGATGLIRLRGPVGARAGGGIVHGDLARGLLFDSGSEP